jgi:clan AA aspartic protease
VIVGSVTARREPAIRLRLIGPTGQSEEILAVIDTGFNGTLALPPTLVAWLSFEREETSRVRLAAGDIRPFDLYSVTVDWDGQPRTVLAFAMGTAPLIGMALLEGYRLTLDAIDGGLVLIEALG